MWFLNPSFFWPNWPKYECLYLHNFQHKWLESPMKTLCSASPFTLFISRCQIVLLIFYCSKSTQAGAQHVPVAFGALRDKIAHKTSTTCLLLSEQLEQVDKCMSSQVKYIISYFWKLTQILYFPYRLPQSQSNYSQDGFVSQGKREFFELSSCQATLKEFVFPRCCL